VTGGEALKKTARVKKFRQMRWEEFSLQCQFALKSNQARRQVQRDFQIFVLAKLRIQSYAAV